MPRIDEQFLDIVFFIYPTKEEAHKGGGSPLGATGFFVSVKSEKHDEITYAYAVTNAHVVEGLKKFGSASAVLRFNTKSGGVDSIELPLGVWRCHPAGDDVAVFPLKLKDQWKCKYLPEEPFFLSKETMEKHGIGTGDETITMGRYSRHSGTNTNLPTVRFGHVSMMPIEPVIQDSRRGFPQESFLVESHSVSGYSGSPVFVEVEPDNRKAPEIVTGKRSFLLGIDWGHFDFNGVVTTDPSGNWKSPSGMMCVVPTWKLKELLYTDELKEHRRNQDKKIAEEAKRSGIALDSNLSEDDLDAILRKQA